MLFLIPPFKKKKRQHIISTYKAVSFLPLPKLRSDLVSSEVLRSGGWLRATEIVLSPITVPSVFKTAWEALCWVQNIH